MTDNILNLAQVTPAAATLTDLLIPGTTTATYLPVVVSSVVICNTNATDVTIRLAHAKDSAVDSIVQYLYYDLPIAAKDTFIFTGGMTLEKIDTLRCYASSANVSFNVYGIKVAP